MKKIFLFDPSCLSYRIHIYKYFIQEFEKNGYDLFVYYDNNVVKKGVDEKKFIGIDYSFASFKKLHLSERPDVSIFYIWLSYQFSLPFLAYCRLFLKVKSIVWSKGINITKIDQPVKNQLYYLRQRLADALILYSDFEKQFIKADQNKVFVANNTINQSVYTIDKSEKQRIKTKDEWNIKHSKTVLFVGRIENRKKVQLLIDVFSKYLKDYALVLVGPGITEAQLKIVSIAENIYSLGPIYDIQKLSDLYSSADIFSIPGHIGLGLNEAFLFGLPVITQDMDTDPKLVSSEPKMLFKDGQNGLYFDGTEEDLRAKMELLLTDDTLREKLSENAIKTFEEKAKIEYMRDGFLASINYVLNEK